VRLPAAILAAVVIVSAGCHAARAPVQAPAPASTSAPERAFALTHEDEAFLEDLSRRSFWFFWSQADPRTGLVRDRARADGSEHDAHHRDVASIAATGFGLASLCIADARGWVPASDVRARARSTLAFLASEMPHERGWFYHFVHVSSGAREWQSELSSIDTALLLAGVLTVRQCLAEDAGIVANATLIYERVDFPWMLNGHPHLLSMGWKPESGFLEARWKHYCELMILYALAIGSPRYPIPADAWHAWERPVIEYAGLRYVSHADPLFVHQYSHFWLDLRGRVERRTGIDWWANSVAATNAHRQFCLDLRDRFPGYTVTLWGITASDSARGYVAWGGPPPQGPIDGSIVPAAAGGSLMFTPEISTTALRAMRDGFGDRVYGRYGFVDAFHPTSGWTNPDVIGIDVGAVLLSAENLRSGRVWTWFMRNQEIVRALDAAGVVRK
jgi:hypothetical protein